MTLTPTEYSQLKTDLLKEVQTTLLKPSRHENSDHLDGGLAPQKIAAVTGTGSQAASGSVLTLDSNKRPSWTSQPGREIGYSAITSSFVSGTLNASRSPSFLSLTITGDGTTPVFVEFWGPAFFVSSASGLSNIDCEMWSGTVGSGSLLSYDQILVSGLTTAGAANVKARISAFAGSITLNMSIRNENATNVVAGVGTSNSVSIFLRATWAG